MKVLIGLKYNKQNVDKIGLYDLEQDKVQLLSTRDAKETYGNKVRAVANADFNFFVNKVNVHIGEQGQYPIIFDNGTIENGIIIYDINKTKNNTYKVLNVANAGVKQIEMNEEQLKQLYKTNRYKCNFSVENNKLKIVYKDDGVYKELIEDNESGAFFNLFNKNHWYKIENEKMEKVSDCTDEIFKSEHGEKIIDGFTNSDKIKEVDLTGATYVVPKAFMNCKNLEKVTFSNSMKQIGTKAFANCPKLKVLNIPKSCDQIGVRIFDNGEVYLEDDILKKEGVFNPFGANTKIYLNGQPIENVETINVAFYEDKTNLYYYNIDLSGVRKEKSKRCSIKKSDIDFTDVFINYKDDKVLQKGKDIICCISGRNYIVLTNKNTWKTPVFANKSIDEIEPTNGVKTGNTIIPMDPSWGWYIIKTQDNKTSGKIGSQIAEMEDESDTLSMEQKKALADYINLKFETKYGKLILGTAKASKKGKELKDQYPGVTFIYGGVFPGGVKCDNPGVYNKETGKVEYKDGLGNYYCYFGHQTIYHIMAQGYKDGKLIKTFTFGKKCAADFLEMDPIALAKITEFQKLLSTAIKEVDNVIKTNSYKKHLQDHYNYYELMNYIKKANRFDLLGPYGKIVQECLDANMIIPEVVKLDVSDYIILNQYELYRLCIKDEKNLEIVYYFGDLINETTGKPVNEIYEICNDYMESCAYDVFKGATYDKLSQVKQQIKNIKVDDVKYANIEKIKKEFEKLKLPVGEYVIDNFYINSRKCEIRQYKPYQRYNYENFKLICDYKHPLTKDFINYFNKNLDKKNIRPTIGSEYVSMENQLIKEAKQLAEILKIKEIPDNIVKVIWNDGYWGDIKKHLVALAFKNTLYCYCTDNNNKPLIFYQNGELNYNGEYGGIAGLKKTHSIYTTFFNPKKQLSYAEIKIDTSRFKFTSVNGALREISGNVDVRETYKAAYTSLIQSYDFGKYSDRELYVSAEELKEAKRQEKEQEKLRIQAEKEAKKREQAAKKEAKERELRAKKEKERTEKHWARVSEMYKELLKYKKIWPELGIIDRDFMRFGQEGEYTRIELIDNLIDNYNKLQAYLKLPEDKRPKPKNYDFLVALENNIADVDKWIENSAYTSAYEQLAKKLLDREPLIGKQYLIVNHMRTDLGKYLNKKF